MGKEDIASSHHPRSIVGTFKRKKVREKGKEKFFFFKTYGGGGADDVGLVDSLERDAVDAVWAGDQAQAGCELLQEDDSLATEWTGKEDADFTRCKRRPEGGGASTLVVLERGWDVHGWVVLWGACGDGSCLAVASTSNFLGDCCCDL